MSLGDALPESRAAKFVEKIVGASAVAHIARSCLPDSTRDIKCPRGKCLPNPLGGLCCDIKPCVLRVVDLPARRILVAGDVGDRARDYTDPQKTWTSGKVQLKCNSRKTRIFYFSL
jgi:hypothetical protein